MTNAPFDPIRYGHEVTVAEDYLNAFMDSEVRFYGNPDNSPFDGGTPTAKDILEGLANTILDMLNPDLGNLGPELDTAVDVLVSATRRQSDGVT